MILPRTTRDFAPVAAGTFLAATARHGLWNLAAVTIGISSVPITASSPPPLAGFGGAAVLLLIAWFLGILGTYTVGAFVHALLVIAIVLFLVGLLSGRRTLG